LGEEEGALPWSTANTTQPGLIRPLLATRPRHVVEENMEDNYHNQETNLGWMVLGEMKEVLTPGLVVLRDQGGAAGLRRLVFGCTFSALFQLFFTPTSRGQHDRAPGRTGIRGPS
jgi:hypothetical protein